MGADEITLAPLTDINGDGINLVEFANIAAHWLKDCGSGSCNGANLDASDTIVNLADLAIFFESWLWGR